VIPEPDGSELADKVISEYYPHDNEDLIQLRGFDQRLERREELTGLIERMEKEKKKIEQELKIFIGENGGAENDYYRVTWKSVSSERLDSRLFKAEQPEVYRRYLRKSESRRFSVKVKAVTTRAA
jgi:predicted phage-related endonuclease